MRSLPYYRNINLKSIVFEYRDPSYMVSSVRESYPECNTSSIRIKRNSQIPVWKRSSLTIDEAAEYSGVGRARLRQLTDREDCPFVLWVGNKRLIRREKLDQYLDKVFSI